MILCTAHVRLLASLTALLMGPTAAYTSVKCGVFMHKTIDPIVHPNEMSHLHTFAGSDAVTRTTETSTQLRAGCSSCDNPCDYSSYWFPALINIHNNEVFTPKHFLAYYINVDGSGAPLPPSLRMVTGNAANTEKNKVDVEGANVRLPSTFKVPLTRQPNFFCYEDNDQHNAHTVEFPDKKCKQGLKEIIAFPNCVNLEDFSHAFAQQSATEEPGPCPSGMVRIPQLRYSIVWDIGDLIPAHDLRLASGNAYSAHADVILGWESNAARDMLRSIGGVRGNNLRPAKCKLPKKRCSPKDAEPDFGTNQFIPPPEVTSLVQSRSREDDGIAHDYDDIAMEYNFAV